MGETQNVTLFGIRIFADIIKVKIKMKSYWTRAGPESNQSVSIRDKTF